MSNARKVAALALSRVFYEGAYSNIALNEALKAADLSRQDSAFVSKIFYGVLDRRLTIDYYIRHYSSQPLSKVSHFVLSVLRLGVYQILYMDKVPHSAAVNEAVKLVKKSKDSRASGYVNAVLRNIIRELPKLPNTDTVDGLSVNYSCGKKLLELYIDSLGMIETEKFLKSALNDSNIYLRVNTLKNSADELKKLFSEQGINAADGFIENSLIITGSGSIEKNSLFADGRFHVQDISSQICADLVRADSNECVLDICAAPGGKSFTIAENMKNTGKVISCDLYEHRVKLIKNGAKRLGITNIEPRVMDATVLNEDFLEIFDRVLCDVPCSGSGVIGRKPDIKYKDFEDLSGLCNIQYEILKNAFKYLKVDGMLVYSTCSILRFENDDVVSKLLENFKNAELISKHTFLPQNDNTDGFFTAVINKTR